MKVNLKPLLLISIITIAGSSAHAQQFSIQLKRPVLKDISSIEQKAGGKEYKFSSNIRFSVSKNYFPGAGKFNLDNPLTWNRAEPGIQVQYYYSLPDSIVRLTEYTLNNSDTVLLKNTFNANAGQITKLLGKPVDDSTENHEDWRQQTIIWQNDETYIEQFIVIGSGTYRVRVLVSWK